MDSRFRGNDGTQGVQGNAQIPVYRLERAETKTGRRL
jgi:hypothetical protein